MNRIIKGDLCFSKNPSELFTLEGGYLIFENGLLVDIFTEIPGRFSDFPIVDYNHSLIIPGLCDLHTHAPQYALRGLGMDMELLEWLSTYTFPEESKYAQFDYANKAYNIFAEAMRKSATTRACVFATLHTPATIALMDKLEESGIVSMVGKVNMDRNCPDYLRQADPYSAYASTQNWIDSVKVRYKNTYPIITPRFIPTCSDELMEMLKLLQAKFKLPVQSHLSENHGEIAWVKELCPDCETYAEAYDKFGLFGGDGVPTVMAHCVSCEESEIELMKERGVYVAHCPQSNINLSSGIAPVRKYLSKGLNVGLGSDVAGGCNLSIFRAMSDAVQVSKMYWRLVDCNYAPLTVNEAFYLGTAGGGSFFGKVGLFKSGYEFDAVIIDDTGIATTNPLSIEERLARVIYFPDDRNIVAKYVRGEEVAL